MTEAERIKKLKARAAACLEKANNLPAVQKLRETAKAFEADAAEREAKYLKLNADRARREEMIEAPETGPS